MASINIAKTENELEARITIAEVGDSFPTLREIKKAIAAAGVVYGIDDSLLARIVAERRCVNNLIFAQGNPTTKGADARLIWHIGNNHSLRPAITEKNRADFKQLKLFEPVSKSQLLISKILPTPGQEGMKVNGERIFEPGANMELPQGKNTYKSKDGLKLYAKIDGHAFWEQGVLNVDNIYHIDGNVDYNTGNIKFDGAVMINGDIRSGFCVEAADSIWVGGNVESATVYSYKGDIVVQSGILGKGKAQIFAGRNLRCGFVQDAALRVAGDITIDHYAINTKISAGGKISLTENEGLIRGGVVAAKKGLEVREAGSAQKLYTELKIGRDPAHPSNAHLWEITKKRNEIRLRVSLLNKRSASLPSENFSCTKKELTIINREIRRLKNKLKEVEQQEIELFKESAREWLRAEIIVLRMLHPNVKIEINGLEYHNQKAVRGVRCFQLGNKILLQKLPASSVNRNLLMEDML